MGLPDIRAGNPLKDSLAAGESAIGTFVRIPAPDAVELCGHAGCEFVLIDMEHSPITWESAAAMVVAAEAASTVPIIRLSRGDRDFVSRALDIGAHGVMVARVETEEEARAIVAATRYGSDGTRGTAGTRRNAFGLLMSLGEFVPAANRSTFVSVQIETVAAVRNVEAIAGVNGLDCLFVGLSDLSVDLDLPGQWDHPDVLEQVALVQDACDAHGVACGVPVPDAALARTFLERGVRLIATGDVGILGRAMRDFVEEVRASAG